MYQRLTLAKDLLREDGVIFVSIDDNEMPSLDLLMKRVFGEGNYIGRIIWWNVTDNNPTRISVEHEYIISYALSIDSIESIWKASTLPIKEKLLELQDELKIKFPDLAERQKEYSKWFKANKVYMWPFDRYKFIDDGGIYTGSQSVHNPGKEGYRYDVPHPETGMPCQEPLMGYRFPEDTMKELLKNEKILFGEDHTKIIELKLYVQDYKAKLPSVIEMDTRLGANELSQIFPEITKAFSFPKPTDLILELLSFTTRDDDIILDFFAGSGTTAQAVQSLNNEDGGNRRFILVSSKENTTEAPDKNLCRDVCAERVRRVFQGFKNKKGDSIEGLGGDFAYLRTRTIPPSAILDIEHDQVWTALQLIHRPTLTPYTEQPFLIAEDEEGALIYVPSFEKERIPSLREAVNRHSSVIVYSWQPGLLRQHLRSSHVQHEAIPESLLRRFGLKS
jgi:adenine-specific DNA-methyltransferase